MSSSSSSGRVSKPAFWVGWVLTVLPSAMLFMSAFMKLSQAPIAVEGFKKQGYPDGSLMWIGLVEVACTVLFLIPRTAVLGAILLVGYLGGATNVHVRLGEPFVIPVVMGVVIWIALYLRDRRVRALAPIRKLGA